ncbi:MAG TPA: glycosyltransferase family 2 protein [Microthrixaceae bacterium]|jgi:succinoglycan biosynthesis protein ExoA|nr:glycosyltransferase family 2 protein [Microthrixaceae bacterium]
MAPTVTVAIPVLDEEAHLGACLDAIEAQTYSGIVEVLVIDGGSSDRSVEIARQHQMVRVLDNPRRIQSAALNRALDEAAGEILVRVDGHCVIAPDYVERCVAALDATGAAIVGGGMTPVANGAMQEAIAAAMGSRIGAGPARFHSSGDAGWVDTVYLGAYRVADAVAVGGYAADMSINEDAEFAIRLASRGGVWFDPTIRSTYTPRSSLAAVARQFYRYGRGRAVTVRRHPASLSPRQLAAPALVLGILSPWRRPVLGAYAAVVAGWSFAGRSDRPARAGLVLPAMHVPWGVGFLTGLVLGGRS